MKEPDEPCSIHHEVKSHISPLFLQAYLRVDRKELSQLWTGGLVTAEGLVKTECFVSIIQCHCLRECP